MNAMRFGVIGLNHNHIYKQVGCLLRGGAELVAFHAIENDLAAEFAKAFPQARRVSSKHEILDNESIDLIASAAIPSERAGLAIEVMRHGKDVLLDKPGMTTLAQLTEVRKVQAETNRFVSIFYSEHFDVPASVRAGELVASGAIGDVLHVTGLGPHRLRKPDRPAWFFDRACTGGILTDIASHQIEQFLFFTGERNARILSASVANRANPDVPEFQDVGDVLLGTGRSIGMIHVDWFTPDGLPTWGDGRLMMTGSKGTIEIRKYIDPAGREGGNHLFLADDKGVQHIDCSDVELPFGRQLIADVRDRTETAMPQDRCFNAMEIALKAQVIAETARS